MRGRSILSLDFSQALLGVFENCYDLPWSHAGKRLQKLIDGGARFQIFEKRSHGYAGSAKNPSAANFGFGALDFPTIGPIQHAVHDMLRDMLRVRNSASSFGVRQEL